MARFIVDTPNGMDTDHINGDTLDNRRCNLRACTRMVNQTNRGKQKNNTTGYKGVYLRTEYRNPAWRAIATKDGKSYHLGQFSNPIDAAKAYNKKAIEMNERYFSKIPKEWDLAFLPVDSSEGIAYLHEMQYCVDFAYMNRKLMLSTIEGIIHEETGAMFYSEINIAHNYAQLEEHNQRNVYVHRKGAISAKQDEIGIIPGSQGSSSFIVKGKGNNESFMSCSHGAGRKMGRKQAVKTLNFDDEKMRLDERGIIHSIRSISDLEEAPGAYKSIDVVMEEQQDLVDILVKLEPLAVIKG